MGMGTGKEGLSRDVSGMQNRNTEGKMEKSVIVTPLNQVAFEPHIHL